VPCNQQRHQVITQLLAGDVITCSEEGEEEEERRARIIGEGSWRGESNAAHKHAN
jgi:hypothetical protein